jgi:PBP1b-binding outer membrane lipoprotein LpoB
MKQIRLLSVLVVVSLVLLLVGCSKPPDAEKQAAKAAMDAAVSAGADRYAGADLDTAKKKWESAESLMKEKKYEEAKKAYIEARAAFEKAAGAVAAGKKAVADQANAAVAGIEEAWNKLKATAKKMEKKMKDKKEAWIADSKAVTEGLTKTKEMIAADPAEVKPKIEELKAMVDKWENTFKEMAAAPVKKSEPTKKKKKR